MPPARSSRYGNTPQQRTCSFSVHTFWPDRLQCLPGQVIPRDKRIRRNALRQRKKRIRACFNRLPLLSEAVEAESNIPHYLEPPPANCDILPVIFGQNHRFASSGLRARPRNSAYRRKPPPRNSISPHASTEPMSMLQRTIFTPLGAEIFDFTVPSPCRSCLTEITPYGVGKVPSAHCRPPGEAVRAPLCNPVRRSKSRAHARFSHAVGPEAQPWQKLWRKPL